VRFWLVGTIVAAAAVAATLTVVILRRMAAPPDPGAAVLGGGYVALPYLAAAGLAVAARRHTFALVVLLVTLLAAAAVGLFLFDASATAMETARRQAATAVLPGEDPDRGPAAKRKAGADMGVAVGGAFSILVAVVVPPAQLAAILAAAGVAALVSYGLRHRAEARRQWELEHTDTRGPAD
jgi:hypothetical protein